MPNFMRRLHRPAAISKSSVTGLASSRSHIVARARSPPRRASARVGSRTICRPTCTSATDSKPSVCSASATALPCGSSRPRRGTMCTATRNGSFRRVSVGSSGAGRLRRIVDVAIASPARAPRRRRRRSRRSRRRRPRPRFPSSGPSLGQRRPRRESTGARSRDWRRSSKPSSTVRTSPYSTYASSAGKKNSRRRKISIR